MIFSIGGVNFGLKYFFGRFWWFWQILDRADFPTYSATLYTHPKKRNFTCTKLKIWYFEDFLTLNLIVTFILLWNYKKPPNNKVKFINMLSRVTPANREKRLCTNSRFFNKLIWTHYMNSIYTVKLQRSTKM